MSLHSHLLSALREQLDLWDSLLTSLPASQITTPRYDLGWSIQDVVTHLWGWQQVSLARLEAGLQNRAPQFPAWLAALPAAWEENPDLTNAQIYRTYHALPWPEVHQNWRDGYRRLIDSAALIPERHLLDADRYPWLDGWSLAFVLIASYDHHQEHYDKVTASLQR